MCKDLRVSWDYLAFQVRAATYLTNVYASYGETPSSRRLEGRVYSENFNPWKQIFTPTYSA